MYRLKKCCDIPHGVCVLRGKPVFKLKQDQSGKIIKHKARWVAKGFLQVFGVDYSKTTLPTVRLKSLRIVLNIAATLDLNICQFDMKTAYLHGELPKNERMFMEQPPDFEEHSPDWVWQLQKGLYILRQRINPIQPGHNPFPWHSNQTSLGRASPPGHPQHSSLALPAWTFPLRYTSQTLLLSFKSL